MSVNNYENKLKDQKNNSFGDINLDQTSLLSPFSGRFLFSCVSSISSLLLKNNRQVAFWYVS